MKTISYHQIHAPESDYLYTATSQLPNAGMGLFTAVPIYKDEMIAVFTGEIVSNDEAKSRADSGQDLYFINLPDQTIMDSMHAKCFAKFANDASPNTSSDLTNNTKIAIDDKGQVGLIATRNIATHEELFCSYGKRYWKKHAILNHNTAL